MHALLSVYRLRDRLALTRSEITALATVLALFAGGLAAQQLPAPPETLSPEVIRFERQFAGAVAAAAADPVPVVTEAAPPESPSKRSAKGLPARPIGINSATAAQLETLPRVGPKMAERILAYRDSRGGFSRIEELRNVRGIGEKTFEQLRPFVTLD